MNFVKALVTKANRFQQSHSPVGFVYGVTKKYGEDQGGYQTALLTYYAFWSLFPLLIAFTTVTELFLKGQPHLRAQASASISNYLPIVGNNLAQQVHGSSKTGIALAISLILTLYGARGVADAFRNAVNHVWRVPQIDRTGFPKSVAQSMLLILLGGLGLVGASIVAGYATGGSHIFWLRIISLLITASLLYGIFLLLFKISLSRNLSVKTHRSGAATCAIVLTILQVAGGYIVTHEFRNLNTLYGSFAVTLGLLFWLSLQAQVIVYALEIATVRYMHLWPRSLNTDELTEADKKAYKTYARKDKLDEDERVKVLLTDKG